MSDQERHRVCVVSAILMNPTISSWARRYWTKVLTQLLLNSDDLRGELVTHSAGLPHLWSQTGHQLKTKLSGGQTYDRDQTQNR